MRSSPNAGNKKRRICHEKQTVIGNAVVDRGHSQIRQSTGKAGRAAAVQAGDSGCAPGIAGCQLTTDTQEDILYKHCETTGKAELQAIRQIKKYLEKLNREHELSDQACRELKQLSKEIDKFVADCKKGKSRKRIG